MMIILPVAVLLHIVAVTAADNPKRVCNKTITRVTGGMCACVHARMQECVRARTCENAGASSGARLQSMNSGKLHIVRQEDILVMVLYKIKAHTIVFRIRILKYYMQIYQHNLLLNDDLWANLKCMHLALLLLLNFVHFILKYNCHEYLNLVSFT